MTRNPYHRALGLLAAVTAALALIVWLVLPLLARDAVDPLWAAAVGAQLLIAGGVLLVVWLAVGALIWRPRTE